MAGSCDIIVQPERKRKADRAGTNAVWAEKLHTDRERKRKSMTHRITEDTFLDSVSGIRYLVRSDYGKIEYPQQLDFYEIILVTSGVLSLNLGGQELTLPMATMLLIRPGDTYARAENESSYVALAFSKRYVEDLVCYMEYDGLQEKEFIRRMRDPIALQHEEFLSVKGYIETIGGMTTADAKNARVLMKTFLFEIFLKYYKPDYGISVPSYEQIPKWLSCALSDWQMPENRQKGLEFFCQYTNFSREHICRTFKKCLKMSPTSYLNRQRLNYAVGLMKNTDTSIIDIAYEAGFKSASRFYQIFKQVYGMSPREYCSLKNVK